MYPQGVTNGRWIRDPTNPAREGALRRPRRSPRPGLMSVRSFRILVCKKIITNVDRFTKIWSFESNEFARKFPKWMLSEEKSDVTYFILIPPLHVNKPAANVEFPELLEKFRLVCLRRFYGFWFFSFPVLQSHCETGVRCHLCHFKKSTRNKKKRVDYVMWGPRGSRVHRWPFLLRFSQTKRVAQINSAKKKQDFNIFLQAHCDIKTDILEHSWHSDIPTCKFILFTMT